MRFENVGTRPSRQKDDAAKQQKKNPAAKDPGPSAIRSPIRSPNHQHPLFLATVNA
jgi:hypothetical protein